MRNCLKSLLIVAVFVAASFVGVKGSAAATGTVSVPMPGVGTVNMNLAGSADLAVNTAPSTYDSGTSMSQSTYSNDLLNYLPGTPDVYSVVCWRFSIAAGPVSVSNTLFSECNAIDSGAAPGSVDALSTLPVQGQIGSDSPSQCAWFFLYDPITQACVYDNTPVGSETGGMASPIEPSLLPNLDPYVGQTLTVDVTTNWCSYLAPAGTDPSYVGANVNMDTNIRPLGCENEDPSFGISAASKNSATTRTLASTSGCQGVSGNNGGIACQLPPVAVGASSYDCHVPKVKGLTLRKANVRLRSHNCRASVRYVRGARAGRVRYQPLAVGTGRPKGYRVKLAVVR